MQYLWRSTAKKCDSPGGFHGQGTNCAAQEFRVLSSRPLFRLQLPFNVGFYDVTRDGKRFLVNARTPQEQMAPLTLVTNWSAQFK
jgi:hypothetical protein